MKKNMNTDYSIKNINENVHLYGWVSKKRNLGNLIFIDLRDRSGIIQLVIKPESSAYQLSSTLKSEYVIECNGKICERENKNLNLKTGEIEVEVENINLLNISSDLPFEIKNDTTALEDTRLKYRYLDLRRDILKNNLIMRHRLTMAIRNYLDKINFLEIETPILCKSTPEGARDYLVPSRVNKNKFYALPQSPQIFKQLLMVSGYERYFQIAKCFRDEDLRIDRQPEFTQLDMEMSFVREEDVIDIAENLIISIFKELIGYEVCKPILRMKYDDAINDYGSDKPDLRFDMKLNDITSIFMNSEFSLFNSIISSNGIINALVVKNASDKYSRKEIDKLVEFVHNYGADGILTLKYNDEISGSIANNISEDELNNLKNSLFLEKNDLVLIICGKKKIVKASLGALRCKLAKDLNLIDENVYKMLWIVDFPLYEYSEEDKRYYACHHPFTSPKDEDVSKLLTEPDKCYAKAYDFVINGYEAGGGSIRIHDKDVQNKMFEALGMNESEINEKFGFLVEAFKYGAPPHGGIAFGLDRLTMLLCKDDNIRDVIAFPKTASASDLMCGCPNYVSSQQLDELYIKEVK